jgi:hypothetical protein
MKISFTLRLVAVLLLALSPAVGTAAAQNMSPTPSPLKQITLTFELQGLPERTAPGSFWEVSYQWRMADQREFDKWSNDGEDIGKERSLGILLSKRSFRNDNLSASENRLFSIAVPVKGELLERLRNAKQRPQIVWLQAMVRIHDGDFGTDTLGRVHPVWGPDFYHNGAARLNMELSLRGQLRWYIKDNPPWGPGQQDGFRQTKSSSH